MAEVCCTKQADRCKELVPAYPHYGKHKSGIMCGEYRCDRFASFTPQGKNGVMIMGAVHRCGCK